MVDADADPAVVTAVILRETREAAAERAASIRTSAPAGEAGGEHFAQSMEAGKGTSLSAPAPVREAEPSSSGMTQILVAAVIVVVLFFVWVAERRSRRSEEVDGG